MAIPIPEPYGGELQSWRKRLGDPRAAAIPTHVTLLPPTPVRSAALPTIDEHLAKIALEGCPFEIRLRGVATFRPLSPVVFLALAAGGRGCAQLEAQVRSGPLYRDVPFPYHPHVTVAHDVPDDVLDRAHEELATYDARFLVWFSLYEHGPDGHWRPQRDFPLGRHLPGPVEGHLPPFPG